MLAGVIADAEKKMQKAIEHLEQDLVTIRTGRANPSLVDRLHVDYYGTEMPLNQLASINIPEARLIVIQPWDKGSISAIEKAIQKSELGLTPSNDGNVIRIALPQLTEDRRRELVRVVHKRVEDGRVAIRNIRREAHDDIRDLRKENMATDDDVKDGEQRLQKVTDRFIAEADRLGKQKETEVMAV
ncbi:MAG TPA: ribosome recycling factor [Chloroflexota bacterium]|nr:ribosome recycling factor [Chloroflexota bacterium]